MGKVVKLHVEDHIIRFPNGTYYSGKAGVGFITNEPKEAFLYTKQGAENKIARLAKTSMFWRDSTVVQFKKESENG